MLIDVVNVWMVDQGNHFTSEELSDYFKIQSGHRTEINNVNIMGSVKVREGEEHTTYIPKSIARNSGCTYDEITHLINYILQFGFDNDIVGCEIKPYEWQEFKRYYGVE